MNIDTGEIREEAAITPAEKKTGRWVPVVDVLKRERQHAARKRRADKERSRRSRKNAIQRKSRQRNRSK